MAYITSVETQSVVSGECLIPPIAGIEAWPSLDPQAIASFHNVGLHLGEGAQNQTGVLNSVGLQSVLGVITRIGFSAGLGGETNAQPIKIDAAAIQTISAAQLLQLYCGLNYITINPATGIFLTSGVGDVFKNGQPICAPCPSDIRLKKDIEPLNNCLDKVLQLQGVSFNWDEDIWTEKAKENSDGDVGLIAQEVEKVIPELVKEFEILPNYDSSDEEVAQQKMKIKGIKYENLTAVLVEAIKEQQEQINSLKQTVQELSTKLAKTCSSCYDG